MYNVIAEPLHAQLMIWWYILEANTAGFKAE